MVSNNGVVIVGDSTSASNDFGAAPLVVNQSPRSGIVRGVWGSKRRFTLIANAAVGGRATSTMRAQFPTEVLARRPGVIHILAGLNNMGGATDVATVDAQVGGALADIEAMAHEGRAAGAVVLVGICWGKPFDGGKMRILGDALRSFCRAEGFRGIDYADALGDRSTPGRVLADAHSYVNPGTGLADRTHLDAAGARRFAEVFLDATADLQLPARPVFANGHDDARNTLDATGWVPGTAGVPTGWRRVGSLTNTTHALVAPERDDDIDGPWWHIAGVDATGSQALTQTFAVGPGHGVEPGDLFRVSGRLVARGFSPGERRTPSAPRSTARSTT